MLSLGEHGSKVGINFQRLAFETKHSYSLFSLSFFRISDLFSTSLDMLTTYSYISSLEVIKMILGYL